LTKGLEEYESFKIAGHSEGDAYGAGIAAYLIEKGHKVDSFLSLSPDEADEYKMPEEPVTYQIHYENDPVSPAMKVENTDYYLLLKGKGATEAHGGTVTTGAIKKLAKHVELLQGSGKESITTNQGTICTDEKK